jgi:protein-L-isoaspartate(D-aspartate) O-methyltransferase
VRTKALWSGLLLLGLALGITAAFILSGRGSSPASLSLKPSAADDRFVAARSEMVQDQLATRGITDTLVLDAMRRVPRHEFVPADELSLAYADLPLPIGYGQTISQPYIVGLMTQLLNIRRGEKVLEIGTGSGYQAAILAELTDQVWTVEIIPELAASAAARLRRLGYTHVAMKNADGYNGWEEQAPFDAVIVTAAPDHVPPPLVRQLKEGGRLLIPVGPPGNIQTLWRIMKRNGQVSSENITGVIFVPLTRGTR